jgi:hypothetical protein
VRLQGSPDRRRCGLGFEAPDDLGLFQQGRLQARVRLHESIDLALLFVEAVWSLTRERARGLNPRAQPEFSCNQK